MGKSGLFVFSFFFKETLGFRGEWVEIPRWGTDECLWEQGRLWLCSEAKDRSKQVWGCHLTSHLQVTLITQHWTKLRLRDWGCEWRVAGSCVTVMDRKHQGRKWTSQVSLEELSPRTWWCLCLKPRMHPGVCQPFLLMDQVGHSRLCSALRMHALVFLSW